jgi:hypothetical protein
MFTLKTGMSTQDLRFSHCWYITTTTKATQCDMLLAICFPSSFLLDLMFSPEDGGDMTCPLKMLVDFQQTTEGSILPEQLYITLLYLCSLLGRMNT